MAASKAGASQLVTALTSNASRHSPIIGFALDGYPIYGPYGWDAAGKVRRMISSYRLRPISKRTTLPDGAVLSPGQEGPGVSDSYPRGAFAEDYEFAPGSGDLDEYNGRLTRTPEFPDGTYAYFLTRWPYLIGPRYYGVQAIPAPSNVFADHPKTGEPATLTLRIRDRQRRALRFLEKIHEQPIHLIVVLSDLSEFAHLHPQPAPGDKFTVDYTFPREGSYTAYADYTPPGGAPAVERFDITVGGDGRAQVQPAPCPDTDVTVRMRAPTHVRAGEDTALSFDFHVRDLEPFLGAWAHVILIRRIARPSSTRT